MLENFSFLGVGQGGNNIVNTIANEHDNVLVINTSTTDLRELNNIDDDRKILAHPKHPEINYNDEESLNISGGAGKEPLVGKNAINQKREYIADKINTYFKNVELIWIVMGMGGGTGSFGSLEILSLLSKMGKRSGVICTVPAFSEGSPEKINTLNSLKLLYKFNRQSKNFHPIIVINNDYLNNSIKGLNFENKWNTANKEIFNDIKMVSDYALKASGSVSFDEADYKNLYKQKGCIYITKTEIDLTNKSDNALFSSVSDSWNKPGKYVIGNVETATGMALLVERPKGMNDGDLITNLYKDTKEKFGAGILCRGVYESTEGIFKKNNMIKVVTLLTGINFPNDYIEDLEKIVQQEKQQLIKKKRSGNINTDLDVVKELNDDENPMNEGVQEDLDVLFDDSLFKDNQNKEDINLDTINWEDLNVK